MKRFHAVGQVPDKFLRAIGISIQLSIFLVGLFVAIPFAIALMEGATYTFFALWLASGLVILVVLMLNKLWKRIRT
jgi:hypothetical protein